MKLISFYAQPTFYVLISFVCKTSGLFFLLLFFCFSSKYIFLSLCKWLCSFTQSVFLLSSLYSTLVYVVFIMNTIHFLSLDPKHVDIIHINAIFTNESEQQPVDTLQILHTLHPSFHIYYKFETHYIYIQKSTKTLIFFSS